MPTLYVVIPVFDEPHTLEPCVRRALLAPLPVGWLAHLLLIDDASGQATAHVADRLAHELGGPHAAFELLRHARNQGKGAALQTGFDRVLSIANDGDAVLTQDGDLEYDPADWKALVAALPDAAHGAVIGNRWERQTPMGLWGRFHSLVNRVLTLFSNALTGIRVHDMECGYKLLRIPLLRAMRPWISERRFGVEPQMVAALARLHAVVREVPVHYNPRDRRRGKKIGPRDGVEAIGVIVRERFRRNPPSRSR